VFLKKGCFDCSKRIRDFVNHRLNEKEKLILNEICKNKTNVTRFVSIISKKYGFSKTSIWHNLRKMKNSGLITFGNSKERGIKARVTFLGMLVENNSMNSVREVYEEWEA